MVITGPVGTSLAKTGPVNIGPGRTGPFKTGPVGTGPVNTGPGRTGSVKTGPVKETFRGCVILILILILIIILMFTVRSGHFAGTSEGGGGDKHTNIGTYRLKRSRVNNNAGRTMLYLGLFCHVKVIANPFS